MLAGAPPPQTAALGGKWSVTLPRGSFDSADRFASESVCSAQDDTVQHEAKSWRVVFSKEARRTREFAFLQTTRECSRGAPGSCGDEKHVASG